MATITVHDVGTPVHVNVANLPLVMPAFTAGMLGIACFGAATATDTFTPPTGWTLLESRSTHHAIYGRILVGGDTAPTIVFNTANLHGGVIIALTGDVPTAIGSAVIASADGFAGSSSGATLPAVTQAANPAWTNGDNFILSYGTRNKTSTSNGAVFSAAPNGDTKLVELQPDSSAEAFGVWGRMQTTRADIPGQTVAYTGGGAQSVSSTGLVIVIPAVAAAGAGILRQMIQHSR